MDSELLPSHLLFCREHFSHMVSRDMVICSVENTDSSLILQIMGDRNGCKGLVITLCHSLCCLNL